MVSGWDAIKSKKKYEELIKKQKEDKEEKAKKEAEPKPEPTPPEPKPVVKKPQIIRDQDTGKISGVELPSGQVYMGSAEDIQNIISKQTPQPTPAGAVEMADVLQREEAGVLAQEVGQYERREAEIPTELSYEQAQKAGVVSAAPGVATGIAGGIITGVGLGAKAGTILGIPGVIVLGAGGAIIGGVAAYYKGYKSNLQTQAADISKGRAYNIMDVEKGMRDLINMQNSRIGDPFLNVDLFNEQLSLIHQAHSQLKMDTNENLNKFIAEDGTKQLMKFDVFYETGRDYEFIQLMHEATISPDPNRVLVYTGVTEEE